MMSAPPPIEYQNASSEVRAVFDDIKKSASHMISNYFIWRQACSRAGTRRPDCLRKRKGHNLPL